jgi:hypothetical protein
MAFIAEGIVCGALRGIVEGSVVPLQDMSKARPMGTPWVGWSVCIVAIRTENDAVGSKRQHETGDIRIDARRLYRMKRRIPWVEFEASVKLRDLPGHRKGRDNVIIPVTLVAYLVLVPGIRNLDTSSIYPCYTSCGP